MQGEKEESKDDDDPFAALRDQPLGGETAGIMNVTVQVQEAITNYFSIFGTKTIDFNPDVSPFKMLHDFVGQKKADAMLKMA